MKSGVYLYGRCVGFQSEPWSNPQTGASGTNFTLGIARDYQDNWGNQQTDVTRVSVSQDDVARVQELANKFKDKPVEVQIVQLARKGGKNGAWLSTFLPKGGLLALAPTSAELKATA